VAAAPWSAADGQRPKARYEVNLIGAAGKLAGSVMQWETIVGLKLYATGSSECHANSAFAKEATGTSERKEPSRYCARAPFVAPQAGCLQDVAVPSEDRQQVSAGARRPRAGVAVGAVPPPRIMRVQSNCASSRNDAARACPLGKAEDVHVDGEHQLALLIKRGSVQAGSPMRTLLRRQQSTTKPIPYGLSRATRSALFSRL
jgi:hypothetical protein